MQRLIDDLLAYSRVAAREVVPAPVDLDALVRDVVADLEERRDQASARVEVAPLPTVRADPTRMRQLFQNLIGNALKFRTPDRPLVVRVYEEPAGGGSPAAGPAGPRPAPVVHLVVEDTGIGIDAEQLERVFDEFRQVDGSPTRRYGGTGIGLALSRQLARRLGGDIAVRSAPGQGSVFSLSVPAGLRGPE